MIDRDTELVNDRLEAMGLAKARPEIDNCLDLIRTRRALAKALRERRCDNVTVGMLVAAACLLSFILGMLL